MSVAVAPLGQQELVPPVPKLTVRTDREAWWGIDPSTVRVSVAWVTVEGERGVATHSFSRGYEGGERLERIRYETELFVEELLEDVPGPGFVYVEQPFAYGHPVPPISYMAMGSIMAAVFLATGARVDPIPPPEWKKAALGAGFGNAKKALVMPWARENGYEGRLEDEADAWAIAAAARRLVALEPA